MPVVPDPETDRRWMRLALTLARRGVGRVAPNPAVGCVIVKDGSVVGRGWTRPGGRPHAERVALDAAGPAARGATAYVTLEPCAHHGRTPPCAEGLRDAGLARVVAAIRDPDPRVDGKGFAILREAGIDVAAGICAAEAEALNAGFLSLHRRGRPWLTLKMAGSLDGRIATASGESRWISDEPARDWAHLLRAEADAILVGMGTVRADDPGLDCRLPGLEDRSPRPVLLDPRLTLSEETGLVRRAAERPPLLLHGPEADPARADALRALGVETEAVPLDDGGVDLAAALAAMGRRGLTRVLCEGGGRLAAALLAGGHVDEVHWATAGVALGAEGRPAVGPLALDRLADAPRMDLTATRRLGPDVLSLWRPRR
ncbi:MAG: bifunctional diaminohydroxyphosphoribosylaminopyrimidine deaminase/5-amino-6-(5-phosphoribosylamino)uracil reductase RibD [Paracoccaceae bacterium]